jgi:hypothetical protein
MKEQSFDPGSIVQETEMLQAKGIFFCGILLSVAVVTP